MQKPEIARFLCFVFKLIGATENMACELSGASNLKGKALTVQTQLKVQASGVS